MSTNVKPDKKVADGLVHIDMVADKLLPVFVEEAAKAGIISNIEVIGISAAARIVGAKDVIFANIPKEKRTEIIEKGKKVCAISSCENFINVDICSAVLSDIAEQIGSVEIGKFGFDKTSLLEYSGLLKGLKK